MSLLNLHKVSAATFLAVILYIAPDVQAQTGTISGFVTDPSGAAFPAPSYGGACSTQCCANRDHR